MKSAVIDGFKRWKDYSGRSSRAQFWWFQLFVVIWPFVALFLSALGIFVGSGRIAQIVSALLAPILMLVIAPPFIAVAVRRMHDVGKSGWFNLVPIYSFYLHLQPPKELGRIPGWIFVERTALVFVGIGATMVITDGVSEITGVLFWGAIYLAIKFRNFKKRDTKNE